MSLAGFSFLIAERHQPLRRLMKDILWARGARFFVEVAEREAILPAIAKARPSAIILDHDGAPLDGVVITRALRALEHEPLRRTPIVLVAAGATPELVQRARNGGVDEFLCKPFSPAQLVQKARAAVHHTREFINVPTYVGPCRRRFVDPFFQGTDRRVGHEEETTLWDPASPAAAATARDLLNLWRA